MTARSYLRSHVILEQSNSSITSSLGPVHWLGLSHFSGLNQWIPSHHFLPVYRNKSSFSNAFCSEYHTLYKVQNHNTANCYVPSLGSFTSDLLLQLFIMLHVWFKNTDLVLVFLTVSKILICKLTVIQSLLSHRNVLEYIKPFGT